MTLHALIPFTFLICTLSLPAPVGAQQLSDEFVSAARDGNVAKVERLLDAGADVNARDDDGQTPLHWAVHFAFRPGAIDNDERGPEVIRVLIDHGADVDARNDSGSTPLFYAYDVPEIAEILVDHGADVNARNDRGATPLHEVAFEGIKDYRNQRIPSQKKVAKLLVRNGADVHARDNNGRDPVELAAQSGSRKGRYGTEIRATIVQASNYTEDLYPPMIVLDSDNKTLSLLNDLYQEYADAYAIAYRCDGGLSHQAIRRKFDATYKQVAQERPRVTYTATKTRRMIGHVDPVVEEVRKYGDTYSHFESAFNNAVSKEIDERGSVDSLDDLVAPEVDSPASCAEAGERLGEELQSVSNLRSRLIDMELIPAGEE